MDNESIKEQVRLLIDDSPETVTFRGQSITVRRTEAYDRMKVLAAGIQDGAEFDVWITDLNVDGAGYPQKNEELTFAEDGTYRIIGIRRSGNPAVFVTASLVKLA